MEPTRVVHVNRDAFDIYVGRQVRYRPDLRPTGFGNPFRPAPGDPDAGNAIARYRAWLMERPQLLARLPELRGKTLGCWCAPLGGLSGDLHGRICHGEVLAALADALDTRCVGCGALITAHEAAGNGGWCNACAYGSYGDAD